MKVREPDFDVEITLSDLESIREAIRKWGKPPSVADEYAGARLYDEFCAWAQFVDTDWTDWDQSEYNHDIGCRYWIQLAIENSSSTTAARLQTAVAPIDARFKTRMRPTWRAFERTPVLHDHPYFWETHTLHPDLAAATG
jgi:hypothetical protein